MPPHIVRDCLVLSVDAQLLLAGLLNQLARIPETDREVFHQANRIGLLPRVCSLFRAPLDQLAVDLADDLRAERLIAPVRERDPTAERGLVPFRNSLNLLTQIWRGK